MKRIKSTLKKTVTACLAVVLSGSLFSPDLIGQTAKISKNYKFSVGTEFMWQDYADVYYLEKDDEMISIKETLKGAMFIEKNSLTSLSHVSSKEITSLPQKAVLESARMINGKGYFFYSLWNKEKEQEELYYRLIDFKKGELESKDNKIITIKGKLAGEMGKQGGTFSYNIEVVNKFDFYESHDKKILMISCRMKPEKRNDDVSIDKYGIYVFKTDGDVLTEDWNKMIRMPYTEKKMDVMDVAVDRTGRVYMAAKVFAADNTKDKGKDGQINYHVEMFHLNKDGAEFTKTKLDLGGKFFASLKINENPAGDIWCAGFYNKGDKRKGKDGDNYSELGYYYIGDKSKKHVAKMRRGSKTKNSASGIYTFKIKREGDLFDTQLYDIPLEIINQYVSKKQVKKNEDAEDDEDGGSEFNNLVMDHVVPAEDGSITFVSEQFKIVESRDSKGRVHHKYYYSDILLTKINSDGKLAFMKRLPKSQMTLDPKKTDQASYHFNDKLDAENYYFFFLDNIKNQDIAKDEVPERHVAGAGGFLTVYKVNKTTGDIVKETVLDTRNVNGNVIENIKVLYFTSNSKNEMVGEVKRKKSAILFKMAVVPGKKS